MSLDALIRAPRPASSIRQARVLDTAATIDAQVRVSIPGHDARQSWGPVHWAPRVGPGGAVVLPNKGDLGVVIIDEHDEVWLLGWDA